MKTCYFCKAALRRRRIEHMHQWDGKRHLIKNVTAEVCPQCGEAFLAPPALRALDRVVSHHDVSPKCSSPSGRGRVRG